MKRLLVIMAVLAAGAGQGQDTLDLRLQSRFDFRTMNSDCPFAVEGDRVYLLKSYPHVVLSILDISRPEHPRLTSQFVLFRDRRDFGFVSIAVSESYLYVSTHIQNLDLDSLWVYDLEGGAAPRLVSKLAVPNDKYPYSYYDPVMKVAGNMLFLAGRGRVSIVDITDRADMRVVGVFQFSGDPYCYDVRGDLACIAVYKRMGDDYGELLVVDISDPAHPTEAGRFDRIFYLGWRPEAECGFGFVRMGDGYCVALSWGLSARPDSLHLLDLSDPDNPTEMAGFNGLGLFTIVGNYLYSYRGGSAVLDISGMQFRQIGGQLPYMSGYFSGVEGNTLVLGNVGDLRLFDIGSPESPIDLGPYSRQGNFMRLLRREDDLILLSPKSITSVNASDSNLLEETDHICPTGAAGSIRGMILLNHDFALTANNQWGGVGELVLIDISDESEMSRFGEPLQLEQQLNGFGLVASESKVYLAQNGGRDTSVIYALDYTDLNNPISTGQLQIAGYNYNPMLTTSGNYLFISKPDGFRVVDVSDPADMMVVAQVDSIPRGIGRMVVSGDWLYAVFGWYWVKAYDISDPEDPIPAVNGLHCPYGISDMKIDPLANMLYIAEGAGGFRIVHLPEPDYFLVLDGAQPAGGTGLIEYNGNLVYSMWGNSLLVYDVSRALGDATPRLIHNPSDFSILPAFPNPFNARTTVGFQLPVGGFVRAGLYDSQGRRVNLMMNDEGGMMNAGEHRLVVNGEGLASGSYWVRVEAGGVRQQVGVRLVR